MAPIVPARVRPWSPAALGALTVAFLVLAGCVWHGHHALGIDLTVQRALGVPPWTQRASEHLGEVAASLGGGLAVALASVALAAAVYVRRGRDGGALLLSAIALPVALAVEVVLKPLVGRQYFGNAYRFPSGHAATVTSVVLVAWLLLGAGRHGRRSRAGAVIVAAAGLAYIAVVSWGVLITRAHSPVDVAGGWVLGAGMALGAAIALDALAGARPDEARQLEAVR